MIEWIVAGATSLTSLGAIIWLTAGRIGDREKLADARIAQVETEGHVDRLTFELEVTRKALAAANARATALEGVIADDINAPVADGLGPADVRGRLLQITKAWADADGVPASGSAPMHHESATAPADAEPVPDK
jgi:hypothetical protein